MSLRIVLAAPILLGILACGARPSSSPVGQWSLAQYHGARVPALRPGAVPGEGTEIRGGTLEFRADSTFEGVLAYVIHDSSQFLDSTRIYGKWSLRKDSLQLSYHTCGYLWCPFPPDTAQGILQRDAIETRAIPGLFDVPTTFTKRS